MKRITAMILALAMLITANCVLAESAEDTDSPATETFVYIVGDSGLRSSMSLGRDEFVHVVEEDGRYIRYTTFLDEEAKRLYDDYNSDRHETTWDELMTYIEALPASITEELDVVPPTQEELDALAGKTIGEIRSALSAPKGMFDGYQAQRNEAGKDVVLIVDCGFFRYAVLVNESYEEYLACKEAGSCESLRARKIARTGLSPNATSLYWVAEGIRKAWEEAGSEGVPPFKTFREACGAGNGSVVSNSRDRVAVAAEIGGRYFRYEASMDEEGKKLYDDYAATDRSDVPAFWEARSRLDRHLDMLPITAAEEVTAAPLTQEELDALTGKSLGELEAALSVMDPLCFYYPERTEAEAEEITFNLICGFFSYNVVINETYEAYLACKEADDYSTLIVKSAVYDSISHNITDFRYHADGTREPDRYVTIQVYNRTGENIMSISIGSADGSSRMTTSPSNEEGFRQGNYPIVYSTMNITSSPIELISWTTEDGSTYEAPVSLEEGEYIITLLPEAEGLIEIRADGPVDRIAD